MMKKLSKEEMLKVVGGVMDDGDEGDGESCTSHRQCERRHGPNCLCSKIIRKCGCVEAPYDPPADQ